MNETLTVGLTKKERDILLRGLRFVRSSVMLAIREPSAEVVNERQEQLLQINSLVEQLSGKQPAGATANV